MLQYSPQDRDQKFVFRQIAMARRHISQLKLLSSLLASRNKSISQKNQAQSKLKPTHKCHQSQFHLLTKTKRPSVTTHQFYQNRTRQKLLAYTQVTLTTSSPNSSINKTIPLSGSKSTLMITE